MQEVCQCDEVLGSALLGDVVDFSLGAVDDVADFRSVGAGVAVLHDTGSGLDEAAQDGLFGDDAGVVASIGGGGDGGDQGVQVGGAADASKQAAAGRPR